MNAHRVTVDELSQRFHQERIPFVAAIKTHRLAEQTGRDPETDAFVGHRRVTPFDRACSQRKATGCCRRWARFCAPWRDA